DCLRGLDIGALEIFVGEDDVLILVVLVALDDVFPVDFLAAFLAEPLVPHRREIALVEHGKLEFLAVFGRIELDRNLHQSEADGTFPERTGHGYVSSLGRTSRVRQSTQMPRPIVRTTNTPHSTHGKNGGSPFIL